jgi:hypothetical protein
MKEIKLYKSPLKSLRLFLLSSIFVIPTFWIISSGDKIETSLWLCILFFGLIFLFSLFNIVDRRVQIIINKTGIWDRSINQDLIKWELIKSASEVNVYKQIFISLELDKSYIPKMKQYKWAKKLSEKFGAKEINLNISYIKVDIEKFITLIEVLSHAEIEERELLINRYRDRIKL